MLGNGIFNSMYNSAIVWSSDSSIYFDGVNDSVKLVGQSGSFDELFSSNGMTVNMWVRFKDAETYSDSTFFQIYSRTNGRILLWWEASSQIVYLMRWDDAGSNVQTTSADLTIANLKSLSHTHLGFIIDSNGMQLVINGQHQPGLVATIPQWGANRLYELYFGVDKNESGNQVNFLNGWIHDITIWDIVNPGAIGEIYNENEPSNVLELRSTNLKYYHNCSEKNFDSSQDPIPTVNQLSSNNPSLVGAIISRHDQIS